MRSGGWGRVLIDRRVERHATDLTTNGGFRPIGNNYNMYYSAFLITVSFYCRLPVLSPDVSEFHSQCLICDVQYPTSIVHCPVPDSWCPMCNDRSRICDVQCPISDVQSVLFSRRRGTFNIWLPCTKIGKLTRGCTSPKVTLEACVRAP